MRVRRLRDARRAHAGGDPRAEGAGAQHQLRDAVLRRAEDADQKVGVAQRQGGRDGGTEQVLPHAQPELPRARLVHFEVRAALPVPLAVHIEHIRDAEDAPLVGDGGAAAAQPAGHRHAAGDNRAARFPAEQRQILQLGRLPRQLAAVIHFPQPLEPEGEQVARGGPAARPVRAQRPFRDKMNAHEHLPFPLL